MKNVRNLRIIMIITLIICIVCLIKLLSINKADDEPQEIKNPTSQKYITTKTLKMADGSEFLKLDVGDISKSDILHNVEECITTALPQIYNDEQNGIDINEEYYKNNKKDIQNKLKIFNYNDFSKFYNVFRKRNINYNNYDSILFKNSSIKNGVVNINAEVYYQENTKISIIIEYQNGNFNGIKISDN